MVGRAGPEREGVLLPMEGFPDLAADRLQGWEGAVRSERGQPPESHCVPRAQPSVVVPYSASTLLLLPPGSGTIIPILQ